MDNLFWYSLSMLSTGKYSKYRRRFLLNLFFLFLISFIGNSFLQVFDELAWLAEHSLKTVVMTCDIPSFVYDKFIRSASLYIAFG